jgi:pimeloyl-ACP methyl ester carboxylesterase
MIWPQATDYNAAVQNPRLCFGDDDLRGGQAVADALGLPRPHSGNFADVYQIQTADKQSWAVKCFTRPVTGLRPRYQAITEHLRQTQRAFMVEFHYLDEGICIRGEWFPIVKMRWVEGFTLNEFIRRHLDKPGVLERLAQMWLRLGQELRDARMAHGDLQHGNVLLTPGSKSGSLALKLIDYDGMFVPALAQTPSGEVGHRNYQHPQRLREGTYNQEMDRFSHLLIYTALRSLRIGGADLWQRHDTQENLLFREEDFRLPGQSCLLRELWRCKDRDVRDLVGRLLLASQGPITSVPALEELVDEKVVRPLTGREEVQVNALLNEAPPAARPSRPNLVRIVPATSGTQTGGRKTAAVAVLDTRETEVTTLETAAPSPPARATPPPLPYTAMPPPLSQLALDYSPDLSPRLFPLLSLLSRPMALAVLGATVLIGLLFVNLLVWTFARQSSPPPPDSRTARLLPLPDVPLRGGYRKEIALQIERNECDEPLTIHVDGLPPELTVPTLKLPPDGEKVSLPLLAPLSFELPPRDVFVSLWQGGRRIDEQQFRLSVSGVARPLLHPPESIRCRPGQSLVFTGRVERRECRERLRLQFDRLPEGVRQECLPAEGNDMPRVKLTVAPDAQLPEPAPLNLLLQVGDAIADTKPLSLIVDRELRVRLNQENTPGTFTLRAGEKDELPVHIERGDYNGPVDIRLEGLPTGVAAIPLVIPSDTSSGTLDIQTAPDAQPGRATARLLVVAGGQKTDEREIALTVERAAAELVANEPEAESQRVTFSTVDHVHLVGTLYPGSKGKKGACVLMLHELDKDCGAAGWRRLARALQAEGHTVLTFDFRGHGESRRVGWNFWRSEVNSRLPDAHKGKVEDGLPETIAARNFPATYMPWLIHDVAAARAFLDLRHEDPDSPVNSFNLVLVGVGRGAAVGSLWLATEGYRYESALNSDAPEIIGNRDVARAVWLGIQTQWRGQPFNVPFWTFLAHEPHPRERTVPADFVFGAADGSANALARLCVSAGGGEAKPILGTNLAGWDFFAKGSPDEKLLHALLTKTLQGHSLQPWAPRQFKARLSYWDLPIAPQGPRGLFLAKTRGERVVHPVPLERFDVRIDGLTPRRPMTPKTDNQLMPPRSG